MNREDSVEYVMVEVFYSHPFTKFQLEIGCILYLPVVNSLCVNLVSCTDLKHFIKHKKCWLLRLTCFASINELFPQQNNTID